jgi:Ohr subfamily peroxiredoxin
MSKALYTAEAHVTGGRKEGHGRTSDGALEVDLRVPRELGGEEDGTNPEQLFAVGYAACFQSALLAIAQGRNVDASGSQIASRVGIGPRSAGGGFGLQVWLDLRAPEIPAEEARELMLRADQRCPYSNATRGNVAVALSVNGQPV